VAFEELKGAEISRWVEKELRYAGAAQAPDQVIAEIIAVGGEDPDAIARLVEKLSLFVDGSQPSVADVRAIDPGRSAASDFALADALVGPKRANAEVLCQQLLSQGSSPFMLIGLLAKTFTTLYRIRAALDRGQGQQEIRNDLGTSPWLFSKYLPLAKQLSLPQLAARLDALLEADFRMKARSLGASALFSSLASDFSPSSRSPFTSWRSAGQLRSSLQWQLRSGRCPSALPKPAPPRLAQRQHPRALRHRRPRLPSLPLRLAQPLPAPFH